MAKLGLGDLQGRVYPQQLGPRRSAFDERFWQMLDAIMRNQMGQAEDISATFRNPDYWQRPAQPASGYPQAPGYFIYGQPVVQARK